MSKKMTRKIKAVWKYYSGREMKYCEEEPENDISMKTGEMIWNDWKLMAIQPETWRS